MKLISLFAGIGGFDLGFERAGFQTVAQVEIDPQCRKLLAARFPEAARFDDVRTCGAHNLPKCDVLTFGFPCQDLSIAGARTGLAGKRSVLFYAASRIANELQPAFLVWENVPGLLSSSDGRDFLAVLVELDRIGYHGAWATVDAQFWGVAQRRRRVFGCFARGDIGAERCAEVFSLSEGVRWHPAPRREAGQRVARPLAVCAPGGSGYRNDADTADNLIAHTLRSEGSDASEDGAGRGTPLTVGALINGAHNGGGSTDRTLTRDESSLPEVAWALQKRDAKGPDSSTKEGHLIPMRRGGFFDGSTASETGAGFWTDDGLARLRVTTSPSQPQTIVALSSKDHGADADKLAPTLRSCGHSGSHANGGGPPAVAQSTGVRRLTPLECARLQGFPDDWLDGLGFADGPKYQMLGNAVAVPVANWIARRLAKELDRGRLP